MPSDQLQALADRIEQVVPASAASPNQRRSEMSKAQIIAVRQLGEVADDFLAAQAGERVSFVIVTQVGEVAQYVTNMERSNGVDMIERLLAHWKANCDDARFGGDE